MTIFKLCLKGAWCRVLPSRHPEPRSEQLDQHGVKALQELKHCAGCLGDICTASCRHGPQIKTETGKQLFLIICWHLLSLELLRLIYKTGHVSLRLLLQSCFASGRVHFSSPCATPQTGFTLQRTQQQCKYKPDECKAIPVECCTSSCHTTTHRKHLCSQFKQKYWSYPSFLLEGKPKTSGNSKRNGLCFEQGSSL